MRYLEPLFKCPILIFYAMVDRRKRGEKLVYTLVNRLQKHG